MNDRIDERKPPVAWQAVLRVGNQQLEPLVLGASITEELGRPYRIELELRVDEAVELASLLGAALELSWQRQDRQRTLRAVVLDVELIGASRNGLELELLAGPPLALLGRGTRSRIIQDATVVEVIEQVLGEALGPETVRLDSSRLGRYEPHDYWVQYRETDLDFVQRVLEREGITFSFVDDGEAERVVLVDANREMEPLDGSGGELAIARRGGESSEEEAIHGFVVAHRTRPTRVRVAERDWRALGDGEIASSDSEDEHGSASVHEYLHDLGARHDPDAVEAGADLTELRARHRLQRNAVTARSARARSDAVLIAPGRVVDVVGHPDVGVDGRYLVLACRHRGQAPDPLATAGARAQDYANEWLCIPQDVEYRAPCRTRAPKIHGVHTATVTGPVAEEIHTDAHGRIRVRMHWDQDAHFRGDGSEPSCWIRVAQTWAGAGFGTLFIPRVGMEVLIAFVDGDPERPLCIGCVYNGNNRAPRWLPDERTRSVIKTRSSPGGDGFNELSFEDAAGHEQVYLHAQRNLDEVVRANHTLQVGVDEANSIGRDRKTTISRHETHVVEQDSIRQVNGSQQVHIAGSLHTVIFGGAGAGEAAAPAAPGADLFVHGTYNINVRDRIVLQCGTSSIELTPATIALKTTGSLQLELPGSAVTLLPGMITQQAAAVVTKTDSGAQLTMSSEVAMSSPEKVKVEAGADTRLTLDLVSARLRAPTANVRGRQALVLGSDVAAAMTAPSVTTEGDAIAVVASTSARIDAAGASAVLEAGTVALNDA